MRCIHWQNITLTQTVWDLRALQESFKNHTKMFTSLPDILKLLQFQKKCLRPPGTPGVFTKSCKNIYKLARHSEASTTSKKCLGPPGTPVVNTWKIFWSLGNYLWLVEILEMNLATSGSPGAFVNISKYILKPWGFIRTCRNSRNMFSNFRKSWSVCKYLEKYSEAWGTFYGL